MTGRFEIANVDSMLFTQILTGSHRGKDGATDCRQVGGLRRRWSHLIKGVSVVDVIRAKYLYHLGQIECADLEEKWITGV